MMTNLRAEKLLRMLEAAGDQPLSSEVLARRMGILRPSVNAAIHVLRQMRPDLAIETVAGQGYRLVKVPAVAPIPVGKVGKLAACLIQADGEFVDGRTLADFAGINFGSLSGYISQLRAERPDLQIQSLKGSGYRLGKGRPAPSTATTRTAWQAPRSAPRPAAQATSLLDQLPPSLAETVKRVASESGEVVTETVLRLLFYGAEVHHDLVGTGTNPLALRRAA